MKLTILCDNRVAPRPGLIGEHGFACHLETENGQYLFDTGNGLGLLNNARLCGIDLNLIDALVLSHGHWDHCGGLLELLKLRGNRPTPVYAHPAIFEEKFSCSKEETRSIGPGFTRAQAEADGAVFHLSPHPFRLAEGLLLSGQIPRTFPLDVDSRLCHRQQGTFLPDPVLDDQSLYLETPQGLSVLCGCAHAGVQNILAQASALTGHHALYALVGGLHLMFNPAEQQQQIILDLQQRDVQFIGLSHCTGDTALGALMNRFGSKVCSASVASEISI